LFLYLTIFCRFIQPYGGKTKKIFLGFLFIFLLNKICYSETYYLANDFSLDNNPNNVWSYGWSVKRGDTFNVFKKSLKVTDCKDIVWWGGITAYLGISYNPTDKEVICNGAYFAPHLVTYHPGFKGENAVIRWTAPENGTYLINAEAMGIDSLGPTTSDISILHNDQIIWSVLINNYNEPKSFSNKLLIGLGDFIDFTCGFGSNENYYYDTTGIDITITKLNECNVADSDKDGVIDIWDHCPKTPENSCVNNKGCSCELSVIDEKGTVSKGKWRTYYANIDNTYSNIVVKIQNLTSDVDLYVKKSTKPDFNNYDCRPYKGGKRDEVCDLTNSGDDLWYISVYGYKPGDFTISVKAKR